MIFFTSFPRRCVFLRIFFAENSLVLSDALKDCRGLRGFWRGGREPLVGQYKVREWHDDLLRHR
jgi:hypothetical protein